MAQLTDIEFERFKDDFLYHNFSNKELSKKYNVTFRTVESVCQKVIDSLNYGDSLNFIRKSRITENTLMSQPNFFESPQVTIGDLKRMKDPDQFLRDNYL